MPSSVDLAIDAYMIIGWGVIAIVVYRVGRGWVRSYRRARKDWRRYGK